jgi:hypothetical protein
VIVQIVLGALEGDPGDQREDPAFKQETPSGRNVRSPEAGQVRDGGRPGPQQQRPILQGLDVPALYATGQLGQDGGRDLSLCGDCHPCRDNGGNSDQQDNRGPFHGHHPSMCVGLMTSRCSFLVV